MIEDKFSFEKNKLVVLVGIKLPTDDVLDVENSIAELGLLANTLGLVVVGKFIQARSRIESDFFIGRGKLDEIKNYIGMNDVDSVIFDNDLSGGQERNIEKYLGVPIFSRTEVILNIFNKRAKTNEAKLQVQLASLEYMRPRLKNRWDHFSRVEGGIGMRGGEGEKQLELDRRMIKAQIDRIKKKLSAVDVQMKNRRKKRLAGNVVSIVGYTNAGKSSLTNLLSKSALYVEDMLFATLDASIRNVYINDKLSILLTDTVGFINKLPHGLVASFKSTLDEILSSRLLLHVIDISSPSIQNNMTSVANVLHEIDADNIPTLTVYNKVDLLDNFDYETANIKSKDTVYISVKNKIGIECLKNKIYDFFMEDDNATEKNS